MSKARLAFLFAAVFAASVPCLSASAQLRSLSWNVGQLPQPGGTTIYLLNVFQFGYTSFGVPSGGAFLTAPNGTVFSDSSIGASFNSFTDLSGTLFGDWVATEHPTSGADRTYTVRIAPYTLGDVLSNTPFITSPIPGSTVPADFVVKWDPNNPTSSRVVVYGAPGLNISAPQLGVDGFFSAGFHTQLLQPAPVQLPLLAGVKTTQLAPSVVDRSPSLNGQLITTSLAFTAYSLGAMYQVVPEPSGFVLTVTLVCFRCTRVRRNRNPFPKKLTT